MLAVWTLVLFHGEALAHQRGSESGTVHVMTYACQNYCNEPILLRYIPIDNAIYHQTYTEGSYGEKLSNIYS